MVNFDPDSARPTAEVLKAIARVRDNKAGVYGKRHATRPRRGGAARVLSVVGQGLRAQVNRPRSHAVSAAQQPAEADGAREARGGLRRGARAPAA
jgi:hypothetical protein